MQFSDKAVESFDPEAVAWMRSEADRALMQRSVPAYGVYFLAGLAFVAMTSYHHEAPIVSVVFLALLGIVGLGRVTLHIAGGGLRDRRSPLWRVLFDTSAHASSAVFTAFLCLLIHRDGVQARTIVLLLCSSSFTAGATNTLAPRWPLLPAFLFVSVTPVAVFLLLSPHAWGRWLAGLVGMHLVFHLVEGRRLHRQFWSGLENRVLIEKRQAERDAMRTRLLVTDRLASLGTLAAGVAHELNNPLAYVAGNLDYMARALKDGVPADAAGIEELRELVADAREGAQRARAIIQDLRTFSRDHGDDRRTVELRPVVELATKMAAHELKPRARLVVDVPEDLQVHASDTRLGQVVLSLVVNAAQAISIGRPEENEVRVVARAEGGQVVLEVHDTGSGIPPEVGARVFEPFFTTKPVGAGTGLGLSIAHGIVTGLGGEISFESVPGRGTTFRVLLPVPQECAESLAC